MSERLGQVYIAQCGPKGPVKIGYSFRVESRIKALEANSAFPIYLRRTIDGPPAFEKNFHHKFRHCRIGGEWFYFCDAMLTYRPIDRNSKHPQPPRNWRELRA